MLKQEINIETGRKYTTFGELEVGEMLKIGDFIKDSRYVGMIALRVHSNKVIILNNGHILPVRCNLCGLKLISGEDVVLVQP